MGAISAASKIPWRDIIKYSPAAIKALKEILDPITKRLKNPPAAPLDSRLTEVENDLRNSLSALEHTSEELAKRIQELGRAGEILTARIRIALIVAFISTVAAIIAVVVALFYHV